MGQVNDVRVETISVDSWPFVARKDLVTNLATRLLDPDGPGLVVFGVAGSGKSALARAVIDELAAGVFVSSLNVVSGESGTPYAALSNVLVDLPPVEAQGPLAVARALAAVLAERGAGRPCVVWVDDAHLIDEASAIVLSRLALAGKVRLLLTARPAAQVPQSLAALLLNGRTVRVDLGRLSEQDVAEVLAAVLGAPATLGAARQLWRASDGNPLYIREMIRDAFQDGRLVHSDGLWAWRGPDAEAGQHLREMVAAQLSDRSPAHREVLELVALAEPIGVPVLLELVAPDDLDELEREHLVIVEGHSPPTVRLAHPIYGEAVRALIPTGRRVELRRRVVAALEDATEDSLLALLRSVGWALDVGDRVEPEQLVLAAERANRWHDYVFAARAATVALDTAVGHRARLELSFALRFIGRVGESLAVLEAGIGSDATEQIDLLLARAGVLQYALDRVDEAMDCLDRAGELVPDENARRRVAARRFVHAVYGGSGVTRRWAGEQLLTDPASCDRVRGEVAPSVALVRSLVGDSDSALALLEQWTQYAPRAIDRDPWAAEELVYMTVAISLLRGTLPDLVETAGQLEAGDPTVRFDPGMEELATGWFELNVGRMSSAVGLLGAAAASFAAHDASGFKALALALAAEAAAVAGDRERALLFAAECRTTPPRASRLLQGQVDRALLWPDALARGFGRAIEDARSLADGLFTRGEFGTAMHVLHDAVRLGDESAASRVAALANSCDGPRLTACGLHAAALLRRDGQALAEAAERFATLGLQVHAAEAWTDAAAAYRRTGRRDSARRAASAATVLTAELGGVATPRLLRTAGVQPLTRRELEIVTLAARNLSNAEIAGALGVGRRTVEGHLHRAYGKLGVSNREELAQVLR